MPRSGYQVFTDSNTKVVSAYGGSGPSGGGGAKAGRVKVDKVEFTMGSSAGAGSGEFHKYLGARNREKERIEEMEQSAKVEEEKRAFAERVERNRLEAEERTRRNAEKRKKLKMKKEMRKKRRTLGGSEEDGEDGDSDEEVSGNGNGGGAAVSEQAEGEDSAVVVAPAETLLPSSTEAV